MLKALEAAKKGRLQVAETLLTKVIKDYPANAAAYINLGIVYYQQDLLDKAEETFKKALTVYETSTVAHNYLGIIYRKTGRFEDARKAYEKAIELDPNYAYPHLNQGVLYDLYLRDYPKAVLAYKNYLKLVPTEEKQVNSWLADLNKRIKSESKKKVDDAIP